ncbi:MAG TPA: magnesium and cobalt transport protein CorA [Phycisphaerales bacterium]|nr:magnesium and cobalt transport protein CorA [Phycisphaerales bacterium]
MSPAARKRIRKVALPPGTLVYVGAERAEPVRISVIHYDADRIEQRQVASAGEAADFRGRPGVAWINVDGLHQLEVIEELGRRFDLHPLVLEDIANTAQRPKLEDYGQSLFIVVKMLTWNDQAARVESEQVSLILGQDFLLTFQERPGDVFDLIRDRLRNDKGRIRRMGADYLAYALLDAILDYYFTVLEQIGDRIEILEDLEVRNPRPETLREIHRLKREMITLRRAAWPLRDVVNSLERGKNSLLREDTGVYFRDLYDHAVQVIENTETYRDMLSGLLDLYMSAVSNRMNEVMKVLTIIATIFIPLTFIAGIYGMNFEFMPELGRPWGYPAALGVMALVALAMLIYFRRKKWL